MSLEKFIKEFELLKLKFPRVDRTFSNVDNCDFCEDVFDSKNCYWAFNGSELQNCLYNTDGYKEIDDIECDNAVLTERCFECTDIAECTDCYYTNQSVRCFNVWHSYMCVDCSDCLGCSNLKNKSFCIFNIQYTKSEYQEEIKKLLKKSQNEIHQKVNKLKSSFPRINSYYDDAINSEYGDSIYFVTNLYYSFDCSHSQDCGYMELSHYCKDTWDSIYCLTVERSNWVSYSTSCYGCYMVERSTRCYDSYYLYNCTDCHDCFGCANLTNARYCVKNIQFTKSEYETKLKELKKELGICFSVGKN